MAAPHWCFSGVQWLFIHPCDIHKVSRLLTGKEGQLKKEVPSVAMMTNFGFGPQHVQVHFIPLRDRALRHNTFLHARMRLNPACLY